MQYHQQMVGQGHHLVEDNQVTDHDHVMMMIIRQEEEVDQEVQDHEMILQTMNSTCSAMYL